MDENNIQTVIDQIAIEVDPPEPELDANGNPVVVDDDPAPAPEPNPEDDATSNKAFAAMRIANKELAAKIAELEAKLVTPAPTPTPEPDVKTNELTIKDTDSPEVKLLKEQVLELKEGFKTLEEDRNTRVTRETESKLIGELQTLSTTHALDRPALMQFAKDAEAAGFILGQTPLSVEQIYTVVYHDSLVAKAVAAVEAQVNIESAPASGPGSTNTTKTGSKTVRTMVGDIIKDLNIN